MRGGSEAGGGLHARAQLIGLAPAAPSVREIGTGVMRFWKRGAEELDGPPRQAALRPHGELVHPTRDSRQIVVDSRWAVQTEDEGRGVNTNVTQQRQIDEQQAHLLQQAEAAEAQFRGLLESAPDPIVIVDGSGAMRLVNRQTELVFGYDRAELLGQPVEVLMPDRFRHRHLDQRSGYQADPHTRPMGIGLELCGRRKDGSEFPVEISLSPMRSAGEPLVISTIRDITGRKQGEERLRAVAADLARSNAELEQFAYVASHDLQEPLRMVAGYTQLLARRYQGQLDADADEFIGFAVDGAKRMQDLINDLLAYSRVGTRALQLQAVDTGEVVEGVLADLAGAIEAARATVTCAALPTLRADPTQLRQLFQNLIANAVKFHGERPPEVRVSAEACSGGWRFAVQDNGIGIEPEYRERIFVLFQRLHTRAEYPGTGIGLAICRKIVERHGGRIWVESEPGQGTTFWFTLPAQPTEGGTP